MGWCGFFLVVSLFAFPGTGCRQIVGIESSAQFDGESRPKTCNASSFTNTTCAGCMGTSCCEELDQCTALQGCNDLNVCIGLCGGVPSCTSACRKRFPKGYGVEAASLYNCQATRCATECGVTCGGYVYPNDNCAACGVARCCSEATKCAADVECSALGACEHSCSLNDDVCLEHCEHAHPKGIVAERAFGTCLSSSCATSCVASNWSCLESLQTSRRPTGTSYISITYRFSDYETPNAVRAGSSELAGIPNLTVTACATEDLDCSAPLDAHQYSYTCPPCPQFFEPARTDANGEVMLRFPLFSFNGYVEVTGEDLTPSLVFLPELNRNYVAPRINLLKKSDSAGLAASLPGLALNRGNIIVQPFDCRGAPAGGVKLTIEQSEGSTPFFLKGGLPSTTATETDPNDAIGGFLNVIPDSALTLRAVAENGLKYQPVHVFARAGANTFVQLHASPP